MVDTMDDAATQACQILETQGWKRRDGAWVHPEKGAPQHGYAVAAIGAESIDLDTVSATMHEAMVKWLVRAGVQATVGWSLGFVKTEFKRRAGEKAEVVEVTAYAIA